MSARARWYFATTRASPQPFAATTEEATAAGEAALWHALTAIQGPVLVVRGEQSDLLSRETVEKMVATGQGGVERWKSRASGMRRRFSSPSRSTSRAGSLSVRRDAS